MARLNEPAAPVETIDALKRRFIRQNREIARVNSTQSLRIRTLESEISHFLSENITLRQHIIRLQHEIDRSPGRMVLDNMGNIKGKLEAKLTEIGTLVQELGKIQTDVGNRRSPKRKLTICNSPKKSPDQKVWKNVLTLADVTGGGDGRLPPIVEDKYFPRKTLDAEELLGIFPDVANTIDSPELGPPPIAHFENGDPTKFDPSGENVQSEKPHIAEDGMPTAMFANLETRKRRRETSNLRETISRGTDSHHLENSTAMEQPTSMRNSLKSGAKRKLDAAADDHRGAGKVTEDDDFKFDKTRIDPAVKHTLRSEPPKSENAGIQKCLQEPSAEFSHANVKETSAAMGKTRKALGPKSTNTDPTSPSKIRKLAVNSKVGDPNDRLPKRILDGKRLKEKPQNALLGMPKDLDAPNPDRMSPEPEDSHPETPATAPEDTFTPDASEPSSDVRPASKDTPPPSDLDLDTCGTGVFDPAERATRRPRGSVSYTEPNLRAKMRRPTKDLADAVKPGEQSKHAIVILDGETPREFDTSVEKGGLRTVIIKKENFADPSDLWQIPSSTETEAHGDRFQIQASSPLENTAAGRLANHLIAETLVEQLPIEEVQEKKPSGAGSAIAALSAGRLNSRKRDGNEGTREVAEGRRDVGALGASPPADDHQERTDEVVAAESKTETDGVNNTTRSHRRYSSMPKEEGKVGESRPAAAGSMVKRRERKRESLMTAAANDVHTGTELRNARSAARLQAGGGGRGGVEGVGMGIGRAERAASRRRSMML